MKVVRVVLILIVLCFAVEVFAENWVYYAKSDGASFYYDADRLSKSDDLRTVWVQMVDPVTNRFYITLEQYRCEDKTNRVVDTRVYNNTTEVLISRSTDIFAEWQYTRPGTAPDILTKIICKKWWQ